MEATLNGNCTITREDIEKLNDPEKGIFHKIPNNLKRKKSNPMSFDIKLNEEQKIAKNIILQNDVIVLIGRAGSGKTLLSCQAALDAYFRSEINTIYITRPTVSKEEIGYLPGSIKEKMDPWLEPIYENINMVYGKTKEKKEKIKKMLDNEEIKISPVAFMRGKTKVNSYIIVDECQNITKDQMLMILTRLGKGSKLIFCGDSAQIDLKKKEDSGLAYLLKVGEGIQGFSKFELKENHRHPIVEEFVNKIDRMEAENKRKKDAA